jgi:hypothetical protein
LRRRGRRMPPDGLRSAASRSEIAGCWSARLPRKCRTARGREVQSKLSQPLLRSARFGVQVLNRLRS